MTVAPTRGAWIVAVALGVVCAAGVASQPSPNRVLLPVDQAASMPDFFSFRAQLQATIARRDTQALLAVVDESIKNGFGGNDGKAEFEKHWQPATGSTIWEVLGTVLALGGMTSGDDSFIAPYVFAAWPQGYDAFEHVAVVGSHVRLREAPKPDAREVGVLTFQILKLARVEPAPPDEWTAVVGPNGRTAYVHSSLVRSPIDHRAFFTRKGGTWRMVMLLAGD